MSLKFVPKQSIIAISILFWLCVIAFIISERSEWHGSTNVGAIGRQGATRRALFERETSDGHILDVLASETISHNPRVKVFHDFLSAEECEGMIQAGIGALTPSFVVGKKGNNEASQSRTSQGTFLTHHTQLIRRIEARIARVTMLPVENQEAFYLLRYNTGQQYKTHPDYFAKATKEAADVVENAGGQRVATVLCYLNVPEQGGSTRFVKGGIEVMPKRGMALFWWDTFPNGTVDHNSWHSGQPVEKGTKFAATKWIRERAFGQKLRKIAPVDVPGGDF